jgi:hypothetical protein
MLSKGLETARNIFAQAQEIQTSFNGMSIANLKGWSRHEGCPLRLYIAGDDANFYIGTDEYHALRIELPPTFW